MEEIKIIKEQLKKLSKKGISLDVVNGAICFVSHELLKNTIEEYDRSTKKWNGMSKDVENYDIIDSSKYIIDSI